MNRGRLPPSLAPLVHNPFAPACRGRACPARSFAITAPLSLASQRGSSPLRGGQRAGRPTSCPLTAAYLRGVGDAAPYRHHCKPSGYLQGRNLSLPHRLAISSRSPIRLITPPCSPHPSADPPPSRIFLFPVYQTPLLYAINYRVHFRLHHKKRPVCVIPADRPSPLNTLKTAPVLPAACQGCAR